MLFFRTVRVKCAVSHIALGSQPGRAKPTGAGSLAPPRLKSAIRLPHNFRSLPAKGGKTATERIKFNSDD
jgi:hypothetical protein